MKHKSFIRHLWMLLVLLLAVPLGAWADRDVNQLQFGKQTIEVADNEVITFYDWKGTDDISSSSSNNAHSLTVFTPATEGKSIEITFEYCDIANDGNSWPGKVYVYSGNPCADDSFSWATGTQGVNASTTMPDGNVLATMDGSFTNVSYTSESADGALSIGVLWRFAKDSKGWKATVRSVKLENMTVTGAGSHYNDVVNPPSSKQNVVLASAYVTAEGVMNPDHVTAIGFQMLQNESAMNPTALKLFNGDNQVDATVSADGENYVFTLDEALSSGITNFTVKGDFLGTAAIGAVVEVAITKITTTGLPDGITPFTAGTSVPVENPALVLMTSEPQTITVGETSLQFYDAGGVDGTIKGTASGQVTFLPGVNGKKVMVDFSTITINNGSQYFQVLKIYNGTEPLAANLIAEKRSGESGIVRSTSSDGALTIVLEAAQQTYDYAGWEAMVSLFTPQPMDFDNVATSAASTETVCAGDVNQEMLSVNVTAVNTEPAMQVMKMSFSTGGTNALVSHATLYFGSAKVGETDVTADAFDITLTSPQSLVEGSNLFTLKYDISEEAFNEQTVSANLTAVTALVNGAEKTQSVNAAAASRAVLNIVFSHLDQGTVTKTVNGSMAFETKKASSYSSYCEAGTDDRVNIFVPKNPGMVCQIDFSEFEVQYASSSYGTKSTFKIYAGQGTNGTLLWELNDNSQQSTGPGEIIRSTAADGALTIVFNPKSSYSYYYKGWTATVSEYLSKNMEVTAVEATQDNTTDASIGAANVELLDVNVATDGNLNPLSLSAITLNLKGTNANITKVSLWKGDEKLGEADASTAVTMSLTEPVALVEGDNHFMVKVDTNADAEEGATIDAKVVSVNVGTEVAATSGDPEGQRTLKNILLMTEGNHGTITLALGKQTMIYDDGGPDADGGNGVEAVVTLAPAGDADCIKLTDMGMALNGTTYIYIYKGGEVNDDNLIETFNGTLAKFNKIVSDADFDGGKLTIKAVIKGAYTTKNFAIKAEGYKKSAVAIASVTTEDISGNKVLKGQTDVKMLKVEVNATGDLGSLDITAFNLESVDNSALSATHIYQTGTTTTFSANEEFNGTYTITDEGTYYFWVTADVKSDADVDVDADLYLTDITAGGQQITVDEPAVAVITTASGAKGTYTVGTGATFATIQDAIDDIVPLGIEGPVTIKIKAGNYNEKVRIPYIPGMGSVNTLTLESESGERDVKIYHDQYSSSGYSEDQHKKDHGVVTIYEASYVTLKNLEITTEDYTGYKALVMVKDGSRHVTIDNCYLHAATYGSTSGDAVALVNHTIIDEENKNNDYLTVRNCLLEGGKYGVTMGGTNYVALPKEVGGIVEGNTFKNNGRFMMYAYDELGLKIRNNTFIIDNSDVNLSNGVIDINVRDEYAESTEITGNVFYLSPSTTCTGIYVRQMEASESARAIIANNVINMASANASCSPFKISSGKVKNMDVAHNTFRMTGSAGGAAFWANSTLAAGYGNVNVVNNIIQNETSGYAVNLYNDGNLGTDKFNFQNNVFYTAGSTFFRAASGTTGDFDQFVQATGATGCINAQVEFQSNDILMPANTLEGQLLTALPLSYVTTDVTGQERPSENITIGAYEYAADAVPTMADGYPKAAQVTYESANILVKADQMGKAFVLVKPQADEAPTADNVLASELTATFSADTEAQVSLTELEAATAYTAYVLLQSAGGLNGEISQVQFTTEAAPIVYPDPTCMITDEDLTPYEEDDEIIISQGETASVYGLIGNGTAPFTAKWMNSKHEVIVEKEFDDLETAASTLVKANVGTTGDYIFEVVDANDRVASATIRVIARGDMEVATFENLWTDPEDGFWMGNFAKGYEGSTFLSGTFSFANMADTWGDIVYWGNFAYSQSTDNTFTGDITTEQFNSITGGGVDGSQTFMVANSLYYGGTIDVLNNTDGAVVPGCYLTNSAYTVDAFLNGDGMSTEDGTANGKPTGSIGFKTGDWYKITIIADNGNQKEVYLADYTNADTDEQYYLDTWQWVDLSDLGTVKSLSFNYESSRNNNYGITTPAYFCMDNLGAECPWVEVNHTFLDDARSLSLSEAFEQQDTKGAVVYNIVETLPAEMAGKVSVADGQLTFNGADGEECEVFITCTQRGKTQYAHMHIAVDNGIATAIDRHGNEAQTGAIYGIDGKVLTRGASQKGIRIIRQSDGTVRKVVK